jgi:hypothetical protein
VADDDGFENLRLDDDFVRSARARELSAEDRARRSQQQAAREAEEAAARRQARRYNRLHRRAGRALRRNFRRRLATVLVVAAIAGAAWVIRPRAEQAAKAKTATTVADAAPVDADTATARAVTGPDRPSPQRSENTVPLATPRTPPTETGPYQFLATQIGSAAPVAYDPCRTIGVVVNARTQPPGAAPLVQEAMAEVSAITGLQFHVEGSTDEAPATERSAYQRDRYGDRWAPVLLAWSDPAEQAMLADNVAGYAGSDTTEPPAAKGLRVYVTGEVVLDGPQLATYLRSAKGRATVRSVVLHELGHLVGLAHVEDAHQLMNPEGRTDVFDYAAGDLHGLAQLGTGACVPVL